MRMFPQQVEEHCVRREGICIMNRKIIMKKNIIILCFAALAVLAGCKKENGTKTTVVTFPSNVVLSFTGSSPVSQSLTFKTNVPWTVDGLSAAAWVKVTPTQGDPAGETKDFELVVKVDEYSGATSRTARLNVVFGDQKKEFTVTQGSLHKSSDYSITDDMVFSTTLGRNITNVAQGFDYDPDEDVVYITQKYGAYRNHVGWQKRETRNGNTVAPNYMTLACFSHGNNIWIEKTNGKKYVWAPNFGTRQDDGSYDNPHIVSRFPLESGKTLYNTETTENYYFGLKDTWPAFDFDNDLMAVCDYKKFYIYRLSELEALPVKDITLDFEITYGGKVKDIDAKIPEWKGRPTVKARDCRDVKPVYTVTFDYGKRGLHWQTYCIDNGWIFALLQADKKTEPEVIYDTYVEAYKMDGTKTLYKVRQEYMQNKERLVELGWTDADYCYAEPEGIKVIGDVMYTMYTIRGADKDSAKATRRPVVFRLESPTVGM